MKHLFLAMLFLLVAGFGCGEKPEPDVKPKGSDEIEYRVSSSSGVTVADITYENETGGITDVDDAPLPFSAKFKSTKRPRTLALLVILPDQNGRQQSVTGTMLVNGKEVKSETGVGSSAAISTAYVLQ